MPDSLDYKKRDKQFYFANTEPSFVQIPSMRFIMVNGEGDPNTAPAYQQAIELLYGLSYSIKMSKMGGTAPEGYFEYVVPPLEGLWKVTDEQFDGLHIIDKNKFHWIAMIRQPEFVTAEVLAAAQSELQKKKPQLKTQLARLEDWEEGLCAQVMHIGPYDSEEPTILKLDRFIEEQGYLTDITDARPHHEIYLGDPRKTAPDRLKTLIRHPVKVK